MFEDSEILEFNVSLRASCSFCGKTIKNCPASSVDGKWKFCDLICAKLFYDNHEHFIFDITRYNNYYNDGQLSKKAASVFELCNDVVFEQLPVYKPLPTDASYDNPKLMRKIYGKILTPGLFKSFINETC